MYGLARGWGGPHSIGPRRAVLNAAKGGCWFSAGCPRTLCPTRVKILFLPAIKTLLGHSVGVPIDLSTPNVFMLEFHPPSKSGPKFPGRQREREREREIEIEIEVVIKPNTAGGSVGRARRRHRKVVQNPHSVYYSGRLGGPI